MLKWKRIFLLLLIVCLTFSVTGCFKKKTPESEQKRFHTFLDSLFSEQITSNSISLHFTLARPEKSGIKKITPTLGNFSAEQMEKDKKYMQKCKDKLDSFDYEMLTPTDQITYEILDISFEKSIALLEYPYLFEQLSPTTGIQAQLPIIFAEYCFYTKQDIADYIKLVECTKSYFDKLCTFEKEKASLGNFMPESVADGIIAQCSDFIKEPSKNFLITYFNEKIDTCQGITEEEKEKYKKENEQAVLTSLIPAYDNLITAISEFKKTSKNQEGLCNLKNGKTYYELMVQSETGSDKSIDEMRELLKKTLNQCFGILSTLAVQDSTLYKQYQTLSFPSSDPNEIITHLKSSMLDDFPDATPVNYSVKYVHDSLKNHLSPAMYIVPPLDDYLNNNIYINDNSTYDMTKIFPTLAHEGYPGHLYQNVYFRDLHLHPIRSALTFTGYDEGWATYVECYSYNFANLSQNMTRFLQSNMIAVHCLYSLTDIGIHYDGWSLDDTKTFWKNYVNSEEEAEQIYHAILSEPGSYLPYSIGYLEIIEARNNAKKILGSNFTQLKFHTYLLNFGPAPFSIIEKYLEPSLTNVSNQ